MSYLFNNNLTVLTHYISNLPPTLVKELPAPCTARHISNFPYVSENANTKYEKVILFKFIIFDRL